MLVSIAITASMIYFKLPILGGSESEESGSKPHYFLSQSIPVCESAITERYGKKLHRKNIDSMSTRFDDIRNAHLIFFDIAIKVSGDSVAYTVICTISASNNKIRDFEIIPVSKRAKLRL